MPFPFVLVGAALAGGVLVKVAKSYLRDEKPRDGYCSWCGRETRHVFDRDGLSWKKVGPLSLLGGAVGTTIAGFVCRNIYCCDGCRNLTLPCRAPRCSGFARSTSFYDFEFCGRCSTSNNDHAERATRERSEYNKLVALLRAHETRLQDAEQRRQQDTQLIDALRSRIVELTRELAQYQRRYGFEPPETSP